MMLETDKDTVKKMKFWGKIFVKYVFDKDRLKLKKNGHQNNSTYKVQHQTQKKEWCIKF